MSAGDPVPLEVAMPCAEALLELLAPACERIAIAGSARRRKPAVSDIELVVAPRFETAPAGDLWGEGTVERDCLAELLVEQRDTGELVPRRVILHRANGSLEEARRVGPAYQALEHRGIPVDLFIVRPPAEWGVIFALRTGPGDWNTRLVIECRRYGRRVRGGRLYVLGRHVACPEEADFFRALGQPWVEPVERTIGRVRLQPPSDHPHRYGYGGPLDGPHANVARYCLDCLAPET